METRTARLLRKTTLSPDTSDFTFELCEGRFSGLEPGAHIDVHLPPDLVRQYSIWSWSQDGRQINVAVKHENNGRGGSHAMHALSEGTEVEIGGPRNHFKLQADVGYVTLIAGGIGATPLVAMARELLNTRRDFQVYYLVRSRKFAAMDAKFCALGLGDRYHLHCDDRDGQLDLAGVLQSMPMGSDVYTCGPEPMLNAVLEAGSAMRGGTIHFERFTAASDGDQGHNSAFEVEISSSGAVFHVGATDSILDVLKSNGISVDFGCSEGLCGSCIVDVVEGQVDHRDGILTPEEQATHSYLCTCVSRAKGDRLVLNL
ncbi:PDR/VanB family oxidoreductase [Phaeobacter porticola]|uniref:Flavodoxin reductase (Ferredoxin-NADPH reductase) family 1 n=1 Tax=Phaeobacter porticola TaxID=1844006 RepID=A0A1L3IAF9_9RHOB|nr:PDR/VanB family oxidoreductase [Phaeobacter porticola]APG49064.1 Flavodoxin reductase (ferredoxin-NADPH reductase) family 1 [Phaeobacter porticola]